MYYFVCVNYNNSDFTKSLVESVIRQSHSTTVVVVDNKSKESEVKKLDSLQAVYPTQVKLIKSEENVGYFGGLNLGLKDLPKTRPIIVGNNDLQYDSEFLNLLESNSYPDDVLVVAPNVITKDGYHQNPHCRSRVSERRKFLYDLYFANYFFAKILTWGSRFVNYIKGGRDNSVDQDAGYIHMGIGACYILLPTFFEKFSELDNKVFLYGEEAYLAGQLMSVNAKMYYDPQLVVHHEESATLSKVASKTKYEYMKSSYYDYKKFL